MSKTVFIVAAERSGDELGSALIKDLRDLAPDIRLQGVGGSAMAGQGVSSTVDISALSILGFTEAVKAYPMILARVKEVVRLIMVHQPAAVVLIDSWGFMIRIARALKKQGYPGKIIKYVAPQVWAMREGRSKILAEAVDHLLTIHSFDAPYFERYGLPVTYVGNPMFDTDYTVGNGHELRAELDLPNDAPILGVFFGSRLSEVQRLARPIADTIEILKSRHPDLKFISPLAETVDIDVKAAAGEDLRLQEIIFLPEARKLDVFAASDASLACSGTVTTQLACAGVPTVVTYKVSPVTWFLGKRLFKPDYVSLVNIAAGEALMPECLQEGANGQAMAAAVSSILIDKALAGQTSEYLIAQTDKMRGNGGSASARAAQAVLEILV